MKTPIYAAALLACTALSSGAYAQSSPADTAKPATENAQPATDTAKPAADSAKPATDTARPATEPVRVRHHGRRRGGLFSNWCAYNCYAVSPCQQGGCFGEYGYSRYAYDQDIPFRYRWDRDAIPTDNALGMAYPVTGEWFMRAFERSY
jgi:hypothetical protein